MPLPFMLVLNLGANAVNPSVPIVEAMSVHLLKESFARSAQFNACANKWALFFCRTREKAGGVHMSN